ncbi:MAG: hypothetical protein JW770_04185, partial [Actinobacteria bacterium]|nr:hypothetical protein [Actinomycetota bacterium]
KNSFEGEAAIHLEMSIKNPGNLYIPGKAASASYEPKLIEDNGKLVIDDIYIFRQILEDRISGISREIIAEKFHNTICRAILDMSLLFGSKYGSGIILLSGGVFQNDYLLKNCILSLQNEGFRVFTNVKVPVNDGGISIGQAYLAALNLMTIKKGDRGYVFSSSSQDNQYK